MNIKLIGLILSVIFMAVGCATTSVDQPDATAGSEQAMAAAHEEQAAVDPEDPDRVICKSIKKTGTRLRENVCATARDWEESERHGEEATKEYQRRAWHGTDGN